MENVKIVSPLSIGWANSDMELLFLFNNVQKFANYFNP